MFLLTINDKIILSASELVVYANRVIEMTYLLPFVPFFPLQGYVGEVDNVLLAGEIQYMINRDFMIYGAMLIDEWTPPNTFNNDNHNWFGLQFGLKKNKLFFLNDLLNIEYTWTDRRIYRHKFNVNDYYSYGYPVGFWAGPHAEELYVDYIAENYSKYGCELCFISNKTTSSNQIVQGFGGLCAILRWAMEFQNTYCYESNEQDYEDWEDDFI